MPPQIQTLLNLIRYISYRNIWTRPLSSITTLLGIAIGVSLFISVHQVNRSNLQYFREGIEATSGHANFVITGGDAGFRESLLDEVEKIPGVATIAPIIEVRSWAPKYKESLTVMGVDLLQEHNFRTYKMSEGNVQGDSLSFIAQPDSIVITEEFAKRTSLKLGDVIKLQSPNGEKVFTVRATLAPTGMGKAFGGSVAILDIDAARMAFGKEGKIDRLELMLEDEGQSEEAQKIVTEKIQSVLPEGINLETPASRSQQIENLLTQFQSILTFLGSLTLLVGGFLVFNTVSVSVAQRIQEIGTYRCLGANRTMLTYIFVFEAILIGIVGSLIGSVVGFYLSQVMSKTMGIAVASQFVAETQSHSVKFNPSDVLLSLGVGIIISFFGSLWPSIKAGRVSPIQAVKSGRVMEGLKTTAAQHVAFWSGVLIFSLAVIFSFAYHPPGENVLYESALNIGGILGAALLTPALLKSALHVLQKILPKLKCPSFFVAVKNLLLYRKRSSVNAMNLAVALTLIFVVGAVHESFRTGFLGVARQIFYWELNIGSSKRISSYFNQPVDDRAIKDLEGVAGVERVVGIRYVRVSYEKTQLAVRSHDPILTEDEARSLFNFVERTENYLEAAKQLEDQSSVFVSETFLRSYNKKKGDTIRLATLKGVKDFKIVEVFKEMSVNPTIMMSRNAYKDFYEDNVLNRILVKLQPGANERDIKQKFEESFGEKYPLTITINSEVREQIEDLVNKSFGFLQGIELIAVFIAILGLLNNSFISVLERTREIGFLRAVGMPKSGVRRMVLSEAAVLGGVVGVIAIGFGVVLSYVLISQNLARGFGWRVDFQFPWKMVLYTEFGGMVAALIAALLPAAKAQKIEVAHAVRNE